MKNRCTSSIVSISRTIEGFQSGLQYSSLLLIRGRLQRTSGKWGGGGFEISDISGRGEGGWFVKVRTSKNF